MAKTTNNNELATKLNWGADEYVKYDEMAFYVNHSADWSERNRAKCRARGVDDDNICPWCGKELKNEQNIVVMYVLDDGDGSDDRGSSAKYFLHEGEGRVPFKMGKTCFKAFVKAHKQVYGK